MGNESKSKTQKASLRVQGQSLLCRQLSIFICPFLPVSPDIHSYKLDLGRGKSFRFEQGQGKKNVDEDNGFSADPLNSIWTLTLREMRNKTIFYDQLHEHSSNKWWSEVNHFETLAQTQLPVDHGDHVQSTEVVRRHFLSLHRCVLSISQLEMLRGMEMAPSTRPAISILSRSSNARHFINRRAWPEEDRAWKEK